MLYTESIVKSRWDSQLFCLTSWRYISSDEISPVNTPVILIIGTAVFGSRTLMASLVKIDSLRRFVWNHILWPDYTDIFLWARFILLQLFHNCFEFCDIYELIPLMKRINGVINAMIDICVIKVKDRISIKDNIFSNTKAISLDNKYTFQPGQYCQRK